MIKVNISYNIVVGEFDGLCIIVKKDANNYKLFISRDLLSENGLEIWKFNDENYYTNFIEENIEAFIEGIGDGYYRKFSDGHSIDTIPNKRH